jgi:hypothetical protein
MGKTTVAVAVAHDMLEEFSGVVCFVDAGAIEDAKLVAATVAASLGLSVQTADAMPTLVEYLRTLRMLLVIDNCEHVIDAVATLLETIFREAPGVHILATSREALRGSPPCSCSWNARPQAAIASSWTMRAHRSWPASAADSKASRSPSSSPPDEWAVTVLRPPPIC